MYELPFSSIASWIQLPTGSRYPASIDTTCPRCTRPSVTLQTRGPQEDGARLTVSATARCPACGGDSNIWFVEEEYLFIRPSPAELNRRPLEGYERLPERLRRAYKAALDVYNAGVWTATANSCRRTLEGIVTDLHPDAKGPLDQRLKALPDNVDLSEPLMTLAHAVREGGNLGSHFDLEKEPDRETAEAMLELIEYFLEYVYTLPRMIEDLNQKLEALGQDEEQENG